MTKLESSFKNMVLALTVITLCAAAILASVYTITKEPIERSKMAKEQNAIKKVLPAFEKLGEAETVSLPNGDFTVYKAYDANGNFVGAAVESYSKNGFNGEVHIMVGFDTEENIVDYFVLEQKETPGLGTKMADWFKTDKGGQNIKGKNPSVNRLRVTKDGGEIDAITAATISSRAFLEAVQNAYAAFTNNPDALTDANSGATSSANNETTDANSAATDVNSETTDANSGATDANSGASSVTW